jgi:NTE family protein
MTTTALVLTGGGARAAYQAGVLRGLAALMPPETGPASPFRILCGTSAGAINAGALAASSGDFRAAVDGLATLWSNIHAADIYRTGVGSISVSGARWLSAMALGWMLRRGPRSLFDNAPLGEMLERLHRPDAIAEGLRAGTLQALAITALSYSTGRHVTFYQAHRSIQPWRRSQREAEVAEITPAHMLASSSIPFLFPAIPIQCGGREEHFGDGTIRQISPLSPAIHLGASRIMAIGSASRYRPGWYDTVPAGGYPSLAQIGGQALASIFLDGLTVDIERLQQINGLLARAPELVDSVAGWRPIEVMVMEPSERLEVIAARHLKYLPRTVRALLAPLGGTEARGAAFASYLLFEPEFTNELMALGEHDALQRADELRAFLYGVVPPPTAG